MIFRKIKILHVCIAMILILASVFCYLIIYHIRASILITKPILSDFNDSDRKIFEKELGIKFVKNTVITETKYTEGIDPSLDLIFNFPKDEIDEFYIGIVEHYHEVPMLDPKTRGLITLNGVFMKGYYDNDRKFTILYLYSNENKIIVYITYSDPGASLINVLMKKVR